MTPAKGLVLAFGLTITILTSSEGAMAKTVSMMPTKSVEINDAVLAGGKDTGLLPPPPRFEVEHINGRYVVVVKVWSEPLRRMVSGETVKLDNNNQFTPRGMRWQFTLTPDGYLTWKEVAK